MRTEREGEGRDREVGKQRDDGGERARERSSNGSLFGGGFRCTRGWSDRWKVLRDEGGGCQGNALPASAYFSSARALGSIQHHREFPDQTHPLDTRPSHYLPRPPSSISVSYHAAPSIFSLSPTIFLLLSRFVSRLPSGSFHLCFTVCSFLVQLIPGSAPFLFPSLLFAECTRLSLPGLVTRSPLVLSLFHSTRIYLVVSLVHQPSCLCPAVGSRCSDRKNYRAVFGRSSTKTIESHAKRRDAVN